MSPWSAISILIQQFSALVTVSFSFSIVLFLKLCLPSMVCYTLERKRLHRSGFEFLSTASLWLNPGQIVELCWDLVSSYDPNQMVVPIYRGCWEVGYNACKMACVVPGTSLALVSNSWLKNPAQPCILSLMHVLFLDRRHWSMITGVAQQGVCHLPHTLCPREEEYFIKYFWHCLELPAHGDN